MLLVLAAQGLAFKLVSLPRRRVFPFLFLWPGMSPGPWEGTRRPDATGLRLIGRGVAAMAVGACFASLIPPSPVWLKPWLSIFAFLATIHLGLFDVMAGAWRRAGLPVERICPDPWLSGSLTEFWGARWNRAFHAVASDRVFRPAARRWGIAAGVAAAFLFSGLMHELCISLPAGGGWGGPTLYFALHGVLVLLEKRRLIRSNRLTTAAWVLLPLPLLFHAPFRMEVMLPWVS